jgi:SAM-dependent methyltransferase
MADNARSQAYYDEFSASYEQARHHGYHLLIDRLEMGVVARHLTPGARVLEAGCGTGLILRRLEQAGGQAVGLDLSAGMLSRARARGLRVVQGTVDGLPFPDGAFDLVVSFKVLAHVPPIRETLAELARVTRPGGTLLLELYNRYSLRGLVKTLKPPTRIGRRFNDEDVFTRLDSPRQMLGYLPAGLELLGVRGVRVLTPVARVHDLPLLGPLLGRAEVMAADAPLLRWLGGFLVLELQKRP